MFLLLALLVWTNKFHHSNFCFIEVRKCAHLCRNFVRQILWDDAKWVVLNEHYKFFDVHSFSQLYFSASTKVKLLKYLIFVARSWTIFLISVIQWRNEDWSSFKTKKRRKIYDVNDKHMSDSWCQGDIAYYVMWIIQITVMVERSRDHDAVQAKFSSARRIPISEACVGMTCIKNMRYISVQTR